MTMFAAGSTIGRRYRLSSLIGEGGMASVWRAEDETLRRPVAIKLLFVAPSRDPQAVVDQFLREARIAAAVQHRNVIHTVDFGTTDEGVPYIVMELLQGESLAARMERQPPLRMDEMVRLAELTLRGLSAVHEAGIVHRDLKPQNVFLEQDGEAVYPKILDFGISRSLGASGDLASPVLTQQGVVIGTPHYMAPEQARGEAEIDKRADIYSMGAILYEGLTGRVPFDAGTSHELLVKIITTEPAPLRALRPDVPEVVAECVAQAMARDREHRFIDAKAFRRALQSAADQAFGEHRNKRSSELPAVQAPVPVVRPRPATSAWGDFEGLAEREPRAIEVAQPAGSVANDVGASQPMAAAAQVRARAESLPLSAASGAARAAAARAESLPLPVPGAAARASNPRAEPAQAPARAAQPRAESRAVHAPGRASGPQPRAPSAGYETGARRGSEDRVSTPRHSTGGRRASEARMPAVSVPDVDAAMGGMDDLPGLNEQGALQDDYLLGDNPLDAFTNDAAALELQVEPPRGTAVRRSPPPAAVDTKRKPAVASAAHGDRMVGREVRRSRAIWIVPGLLLFLLCLFLIAPGLVSRAPPDDAAARAREAQNPATRGSSRTLQKAPARDLRAASPALRELMD